MGSDPPGDRWRDVLPGLELGSRVELCAGVPALVVSLRGALPAGADRRGAAQSLADAVEASSEDALEPEIAVFDVTRMDVALFNTLGKFIDWLPRALRGRAWLWAVNQRCAEPITSWFGDRLIAPSLDAALQDLAQRRCAGGFDVHGDGRLLVTCTWSDRGYIETAHREDGDTTDVWFRTRLVERTMRRATGPCQVQWPFPDRSGNENEACRRGARIVIEDGRIREVDFNPHQTRRALPPDWIERIRDLETLEELRMTGSGVSDAAVIEALERFPHLRRLHLGSTQVTDVLANALSRGLGANLEHAYVFGSPVSAVALARLKRARRSLTGVR